MTNILILALTTWRLSSFLANDEDGPFDIFIHIRRWIGIRYNEQAVPYGTNAISRMIACIWCLSVWVGLALTLCYLWQPEITIYASTPFALSALAIGYNRYVA